MPRRARIDVPGALHHVSARGGARRKLFPADADREDFLKRLAAILPETRTRCLAWSLVENQFELLLKTNGAPLGAVMQRLMTGYAVAFNRRHRRSGHLFRDRYRSRLCQEGASLPELVRRIHLGPLRARLVGGLDELERYPYSGHSALLGRIRREWQETQLVLKRYGRTPRAARQNYRRLIAQAAAAPGGHELGSRGLDPRVLGDERFTARVLAGAREPLDRKSQLRCAGIGLEAVAARVFAVTSEEASRFLEPGKERPRVAARSLYCYWAVKELGVSQTELARRLGLSVAGVGFSVRRGESIARERGIRLMDD